MDYAGDPTKYHRQVTQGMPEAHKRGHSRAVMDLVREEQKQLDKFNRLYDSRDDILYKVRSVFPLDLFPDEIVVTIGKIDIVYNEFLTRRVQPVYYQNISDVFVSQGLFFSKFTIIDRGFAGNTVEVQSLKNRDAQEAMNIIQGLVVLIRQGVDFTKLNAQELLPKIRDIGRPKISTNF